MMTCHQGSDIVSLKTKFFAQCSEVRPPTEQEVRKMAITGLSVQPQNLSSVNKWEANAVVSIVLARYLDTSGADDKGHSSRNENALVSQEILSCHWTDCQQHED